MAALKLNEQAKPFTLPGVDDKPHALDDNKFRGNLDELDRGTDASPMRFCRETEPAACRLTS